MKLVYCYKSYIVKTYHMVLMVHRLEECRITGWAFAQGGETPKCSTLLVERTVLESCITMNLAMWDKHPSQSSP